MIRRGWVTDVPWILAGFEIKCLITIQHFTFVIMAESYHSLGCSASHTGNLGSVAQGALELQHWKIRKCHFLSDPCVIGSIF